MLTVFSGLEPQACKQDATVLGSPELPYHRKVLQDVRRQFYGADDDQAFVLSISLESKVVDKIIEEGRAVLQLLEMHLVNVACNDPGAVIGNQLILPMLQERLDEEKRKAAETQAQMQAEGLLEDEVCTMFTPPLCARARCVAILMAVIGSLPSTCAF